MVARVRTEQVSIPAELEIILRAFCGQKAKLHPDARLHHDLRIDGDDAFDLLQKLVAQYGTNLNEMVFADFFPDETEALSYSLTSLLGWKSDKKELTICHLVRVIERGRWFEPEERQPPAIPRMKWRAPAVIAGVVITTVCMIRAAILIFQAGCAGDLKSGIGDVQAALALESQSSEMFQFALAAAFITVFCLPEKGGVVRFWSILGICVAAIVIWFVLAFEVETWGIQAC